MSVAVFVTLLMVVADEHPLIQPVPDSVLIVAGEDDDHDMAIVYRAGNERTRKTVGGHYWSLEYELANDLARESIMEHFVAENERLQGLIRRDAGNRLTFSALREDGGETWCQVWATDGNYTLEIVDEPPPGSTAFQQGAQPSATIAFARGAAELDDDADRALDSIANWLELNPAVRVEVRGHRGPLEDPAIAEMRASAVAGAIVYRGISEERLTTAEDATNQGFEVTVIASEP